MTPAKPAAMAPVGLAAPPCALEPLPVAAGAADDGVLPSVLAIDVVPVLTALSADEEEPPTIEAVESVVDAAEPPLVAVIPDSPDA